MEGRWTLKRTDLGPETDRWSPPEVIESGADPRFPSAVYDGQGTLWIAYSAEAAGGREVLVQSTGRDRSA